MNKERSRFRSKLIPLLCGACLALIVSEVFPVFSIRFWRVACATEFAPGFVSPGGDSRSNEAVLCQGIRSAPTATLCYQLMYRIGNAQGKAYALMGLKDTNWKEYKRLRDDYALRPGQVSMHVGCLTSEVSFEFAAVFLETGSYPPDADRTNALIEELKTHFNALRAASPPPRSL